MKAKKLSFTAIALIFAASLFETATLWLAAGLLCIAVVLYMKNKREVRLAFLWSFLAIICLMIFLTHL